MYMANHLIDLPPILFGMRRRKLIKLSTIPLASVAGCTELSQDPVNVQIENSSEEEANLSIEIKEADSGSSVFTSEITLSPGDGEELRGIISSSGRYDISVGLENGESYSHSWSAPNSDSSTLFVSVNDSNVEFSTLTK
mgnify:CR=1 FL=1